MSYNVCGYEKFFDRREKNLEKWRAEPFLVYPLLYDPSETQCSESAAWQATDRERRVKFGALYIFSNFF